MQNSRTLKSPARGEISFRNPSPTYFSGNGMIEWYEHNVPGSNSNYDRSIHGGEVSTKESMKI